jgi:branched-chain amino acid transport system substrate-binding protein
MMIVTQAIKNCGTITGNLTEDRTCIRDGMAAIEDFDGITGNMTFDEQGDPIKCAVIVQIQNGEFIAFDQACP